jgi:excisionase family DNA binding protein
MANNDKPSSHPARWLVLAGIAVASAGVAAEPIEVMTLDEAAAMLRVPPRIVARMADAGNVPARRVGDDWRFNRSALLQWLQGDRYAYGAIPAESMAEDSPGATVQRLAGDEMATLKGGATGPTRLAQASAAEAAPAPAAAPAAPIGEKPSVRTAEEVALREQIALLKGGAATVELDLAYNRQVRESLGTLRIEQNTSTAALTGRYGLRDNLQITGRLPGNYRRVAAYGSQAAIDAGFRPGSTSETYMGDLSASLVGVPMRERSGRPNLTLSLDAVFPTGAGDKGLGGGITVSKSYDPMVLYAGLNYMYGFDVDPSDDKRILSKNNWGLNLGYAFAINDTLALSGALAGIYRTPQTGTPPAERETWQLQFGLTWQLFPGMFIEPAIAFGIGSASPDMTFSLSLPYTF